jgi:hypothetical protein
LMTIDVPRGSAFFNGAAGQMHSASTDAHCKRDGGKWVAPSGCSSALDRVLISHEKGRSRARGRGRH